jgi:hypothetical protein
MKEFLELGSVPGDEEGAQVGDDGYRDRAKKECTAYSHQLSRKFRGPPEGFSFGIKSFPHDYGSYYEVVAVYENEEAQAFAFKVENNLPARWDATALEELGR